MTLRDNKSLQRTALAAARAAAELRRYTATTWESAEDFQSTKRGGGHLR
jgi:hypothetical protein